MRNLVARYIVGCALLLAALQCFAQVPSTHGGLGKPAAGGCSTPTWYQATFNSTASVVAGSSLGAITTKTFLFAANLDMGAGTNGGGIWGGDQAAGVFAARLVGGGDNLRIDIESATQVVIFDLTGTLSTAGEVRVVVTVDTSQATVGAGVVAFQNDTAMATSGVTWTQNTNPNYTITTDWAIGLTGLNGASTPKIKWLYYDMNNVAGSYPDFTQQGNRDKLKTGTLCSDGSNVTGTAPLVFFGGTAVTDWTTPVNHASTAGNTWSKTNTITRRDDAKRFAANDNGVVYKQASR